MHAKISSAIDSTGPGVPIHQNTHCIAYKIILILPHSVQDILIQNIPLKLVSNANLAKPCPFRKNIVAKCLQRFGLLEIWHYVGVCSQRWVQVSDLLPASIYAIPIAWRGRVHRCMNPMMRSWHEDVFCIAGDVEGNPSGGPLMRSLKASLSYLNCMNLLILTNLVPLIHLHVIELVHDYFR